jgi:hypothetical protein
MNDDVMCIQFIILKTHAISQRAKSAAPSTMVEGQNFLNRLMIDSPYLGALINLKTILPTMVQVVVTGSDLGTMVEMVTEIETKTSSGQT